MNFYEGKVFEKKQIKDSIAIIKIELTEKLNFKPGQFCNLMFEKNGKKLVRPYSFCSLPSKEVEFYIKSYEEGEVANHLLNLKVGDEIKLGKPVGNFKLQENNNEVYLVGAGSGIAPLIAMVRALLETNRKVTLLNGASYVDELGYHEFLKDIDEKNENFTYYATVSREDWDGNKGRVDTLISKFNNTEAEVYICGPPPMVNKIQIELKEKGFEKEKIFIEQYY